MSRTGWGGMGWRPDLPDVRDLHQDSEPIKKALATSQPLKTAVKALPASADLRARCSPIEDQGELGSCTANAGGALFEYFERRAFGKHLDASRLFLYKVTRNLMGAKGGTGAELRDTMKAMVLFGAPPEKYWPYKISRYDGGKKIGRDKGALLIRNSWGADWGDKGYGWLPYSYVENGLAEDFWTLVKAEYVGTDLFK